MTDFFKETSGNCAAVSGLEQSCMEHIAFCVVCLCVFTFISTKCPDKDDDKSQVSPVLILLLSFR